MNKYYIIAAFVLCALSFVIGVSVKRKGNEVVVTKTEQVTIVDTLRIYEPQHIRETIIDTIYVAIEKPILIKDTLYLPLPLERRTYKRDDFYAEVTGYNPRLTYIEVYPKTTIITQSVQKTATKNTLSLGIETSYLNTLSIPIYLEYGRMLHKNVEIYGQIFYDLPGKQWGAGIGAEFKFDW